MKKFLKRIIAITAALAICGTTVFAVTSAFADENGQNVDILFTSDIHSNFNSFNTEYHGEPNTNIGGVARIATIINEQRAKNPDTLYVDGGDFSMGTLFHTLFETQACELRMLGMLGCDVTTFGNHEFNFGSSGLRNMLNAAMNSNEKLPQIVECNIDWSNPGDEASTKEVFDKYGVKDYTMVKKGDTNIAVIGVFGDNALSCEPTCTVNFKTEDARIQAVKDTVAKIKANEKADMIVVVSHCGLDGEEGESEDDILAKEVPDIDVIIAGHSHTELEKPRQYGNTYVVACGEYSETVGLCNLTRKSDGRWELNNYKLIPTLESVQADPVVQAKVDEFEKTIDSDYLAQFNLTKKQVLAQSSFDFCGMDAISDDHQGQNLGDFMSDAYLYGARLAEPDTQFDVSVIPSGTIRGTYTRGNITVDDVFNSYSLGIGPDEVPGYPLIKVYLTGAELKTAAEIDASVSDLMAGTRLYMSGMKFKFSESRMLLNKVFDTKFVDQEGNESELEDDKLYCVVVDLYSGQMLGAVNDVSYGLLSLQPKDENGNPIEDFNDAIIYKDGKEVKAWDVMAQYMQSFPKNEQGISQVPEIYKESQGRKVNDTSASFFESPNKFFFGIIAIVVIVIAIVVLLVVLIVYIVKRIKYGKEYKKIKAEKKANKERKKQLKKEGRM